MNDPVNEDFERTQKLVFVLEQAYHLISKFDFDALSSLLSRLPQG